MTLRELQYLVALAETRHFGKAAEACFVSQPTLSTQLKKLEEQLGVQLIERAPKQVMLTEVGKVISERAQWILRDVEQLKEIARRTKNPEAGTLRLGAFPTLGPYLLPHIVPAITQRFPELELLLVEEKTETLLQRLHDGRIDAALLALPIHDPSLRCETLFSEPFYLAVPKGHPLSKRQQVSVEDLREHTILLLEEGHCLRDQALDVCHLASATERTGFRATSLETLRHMVAANVGMTLLPKLALQPGNDGDTLTTIPFAAPSPNREVAMVWRKSSALDDFLFKVCQELKAVTNELF